MGSHQGDTSLWAHTHHTSGEWESWLLISVSCNLKSPSVHPVGSPNLCRTQFRLAVPHVTTADRLYGNAAQEWHRGEEVGQICDPQYTG